jgi:hypothetical protein
MTHGSLAKRAVEFAPAPPTVKRAPITSRCRWSCRLIEFRSNLETLAQADETGDRKRGRIIHSEFLFLEPVRALNLRVAYFDLVK